VTLWHGRFSTDMDGALWALSESFSFDQVLWRHDIAGSKGHVTGLVAAGLLTREEGQQLHAALDTVAGEFVVGTFERLESDEDIHMAIERRVTSIAGSVGAKLHTGRSRNDQVATTLRLFTRDALSDIAAALFELITALGEVADRFPGAILPGYTHLQRAQPVLLEHHLRAHIIALLRDIDRLASTRTRLNVSPLGAGAIAGTSLPLDPEVPSRVLGFDAPFVNSMDATSDRDFVAETLFDLALVGVHFSRMGEELVLWTTNEFGFATLGDAFTTGSSMLPQKKNSDIAELARGKTGRLVGNLTSLLVMLKGLPLAYNRDLQEDKEPLFDSIRTVQVVAKALTGAYGSLVVHTAVTSAAASDPYSAAIDLAEWLVERGVPFRQAHERVGALVGDAIRSGRPFVDVVADDEQLAAAVHLLAPGQAVANRSSHGASGPSAQAAQRDFVVRECARLQELFREVVTEPL
jgi:argininosuccinate lyase